MRKSRNPDRSAPERSRRLLGAAGLAFAAAMAVACGPSSQDRGPSRDDAAVRAAREQALQRKGLEAVPPPEDVAVTQPVPASLLQNAREHLARISRAPVDQIEVVSAEPQVWPDGAMGCPQPGLTYTHRPVEGYRMVLRAGGRDYDYRVAASGYLVLCEGMWLKDPPVS